MSFQRPFFATLALSYCICLGVFALLNNRHSKLNRAFAFYNFSNALYNAADYLFLIPNHTAALWYDRFVGIGGGLMFPFLMSFVFQLIGVSEQVKYKKIEKVTFVTAGVFACLSLTPFIVKDVRYEFLKSPLNTEIPGPLYILFALWGLITLAIMISAVPASLKSSSNLQKKRSMYVVLACVFGFLAMGIYSIALFSIDLPALYYSCEALVTFTFAYAIFKHNLIAVSVALRRASVLIGIYIGIIVLMIPVVLFCSRAGMGNVPYGPLTLLIFSVGILFSLGPIAYSYMVKHSALLQDASTSDLAHEFKTPLAAIQSAKAILDDELAKTVPDSGKVRDYMDMIQRNTERLEGFVLEILNAAKAGGPLEDFQKEELDLMGLANEVAAQFPNLRERLRMEANESVVVVANKEGIRQTVTNLLSNAVKFCPAGTIRMRVAKLSDGVEVSVQDDGPGIAREDLERIFHPFVQSPEGKKKAKGTGLGLAIAKRWVEAHNGKIWAESAGLGKGARFIFFLPN